MSKHAVIDQFNERGVYTGTVLQDEAFDTVGVFDSTELAIAKCEQLGVEYEILEDEA